MTLSELLHYGDEKDILIVPILVRWYDGDIIESTDVEIVENALEINGAPVDVRQIDIGVFENGLLEFAALSGDGTEYLVHCCF